MSLILCTNSSAQISNDLILKDQYTQKNKDTLTRPIIITKFGKSELKTKFRLNLNFGLRFKLQTEWFESASD